jgi:hypothetical protein
MFFFDALLAQDQTTARREAQEQNSGRLALYRHTHATRGVGPVRLDEPILFDVPFLERPLFTQGAGVKVAPDMAVWHLPVGVAGIWQWRRNVKGHYIGAYLYFEVRMETRDGSVQNYPHVEMIHDLMFSGIAYKDLGDAVSTEAQILAPRPVNFGGL